MTVVRNSNTACRLLDMEASRVSLPAARSRIARVVVLCALASRSCKAFLSPAAGSYSPENRYHAATSGLRAGAVDVLGEDLVLAKFKRLQVSTFSSSSAFGAIVAGPYRACLLKHAYVCGRR